ncbi:lactoylglutathione lyase [Aminobacter sp. DSM 101952]|uniref:bleomycin resistance protein n=1 Tax=Aminobacter sp. DSM 101952 TaxID=2735891 RepID=UPI0006FD6B75|nr:VOC family protein [Aminobacter sp. DSM 101952]KQU74355.1 lactoylglutathione lyase [Aminobacter sp. DSM 101952]
MPNLENLRKQAKSYLRWHRARYFPVAAQIRRFLPRFRDLPDRDVLAAAFRLGDAQELVARKHGFDSWAALIKGLPSMTSPTTPTSRSASIIAAEPQLFVADMKAACAFYVEKLGFELAFSYGEPPFYAQVSRDGGRLNLRQVAGPVFDSGFRAREHDALSCTFAVDDAKPLFLEFDKAGVAFHQPLRTEPWDARTFIVRDPDGNLICFAGE